MKRIAFLTLLLALLTDCGAPASVSAGRVTSAPAENVPIPAGEYTDGAGSSLALALREDGGYQVDFGAYKLFRAEDAEGVREGDVLHFEGTDDGGNAAAAHSTAEGDGLLLAAAESGHPDCPAGREFHFNPEE